MVFINTMEYLTGIISNIIVWVKAANVMWFNHMLVPYFPVVWIMQYVIYLVRTYFSKCGVNLKHKTSVSSNYRECTKALTSWAVHLQVLILQWGIKSLKGKFLPLQAWAGPWGSSRLRLQIFPTFGTMKVVRSSPLRTGRLYPQEFPGTQLFRGWVDPRAHGSVSSFGKNPQRHHWGSILRPSD
jgi:hypothetical protein